MFMGNLHFMHVNNRVIPSLAPRRFVPRTVPYGNLPNTSLCLSCLHVHLLILGPRVSDPASEMA